MSSTNVIMEVTKLQQLISSFSREVNSKFTTYTSQIVALTDRLSKAETLLSVARLGGTIIGEIKWFGFSKDRLPSGYYFCGGEGAYDINSPQGQALNSLDEVYKANMGIQITNEKINLPNFFYQDGRGYFVRAVDGIARQVGSVEEDSFQAHEHYIEGFIPKYPAGTAVNFNQGTIVSNNNQTNRIIKKTGYSEPRYTDETTPLNIGLTPAIFLGV